MNPKTMNIRTNSPRAWLLAARPKTLTGAAVPVMTGLSAAYADGHFQWFPAVLCLLSVLRVLDWPILLGITIVCLAAADRRTFRKVDYVTHFVTV